MSTGDNNANIQLKTEFGLDLENVLVEGEDGYEVYLAKKDNPRRTEQFQSRKLGNGEFADVFLGKMFGKPGLVAFKLLKYDYSPVKPFFAADLPAGRMVNEAQTLLQLNHPNIVRCYDFEIVKLGKVFSPIVVMQYIEDARILNPIFRESYGKEELLDYFDQIASALDYTHSKGFIHGDVQIKNLLFNRSERKIYLTDFAEARRIGTRDLKSKYVSHRPGFAQLSVLESEMRTGITTLRDKWGFVASVFVVLSGYLPFGAGSTSDETIKRAEDPNNLFRFIDDPRLVELFGKDKCKLLDAYFLKFLVLKEYKNENGELYSVANLAKTLRAILRPKQ